MSGTPETNADDLSAHPERSAVDLWGLVAGASVISAGMAAFEIAPASVTPLIRESLGIGATAAGLLVGVMFGAAVMASLPAGVLLDRLDTRRTMAAAVGLVFATGLWGWGAGVTGDYTSLLVSRFIGGIGFVVSWNAAIDIVSEAASAANRATVVSVFTASAPLGFAIGQGLSPPIAAWFGWPMIFVAYTGLSVLGLAVFWMTSHRLGSSEGATPSPSELVAVWRNRNVLLVSGLAFLGFALYLFVNSWGPSYLTEEVGLSLGLSGLILALFPAMGIVGRISGGVLSDRLFSGRRRPIALIAFVVTAPLLAGFTVLRSIPLLVVVLLLAGIAIQLLLGLVFVYVRELVPNRVAATAVATVTATGLGGAFVSPIVGGAVIDVSGFPMAFLGAGLLSALGIVLAWWTPEP